ncbi:PEP-CTERM sorting domain-containing protein [Chlorogloeopsis sp. ULAP02]|uniref:PEP-CTERM sorting domain-containing protein n=1 Tax=Chlorogloeopsis sp. ULAP02 TaxID=3107926 RepID=UPI0031357C54
MSFRYPNQYKYDKYGIYFYADGIISKVIDSEDTLVANKTLARLFFGSHGLDGESLAFSAHFTDGSWGVFQADRISEPVPEPLTLGGTAVAGVIGFWFKKKKKKVAV